MNKEQLRKELEDAFEAGYEYRTSLIPEIASIHGQTMPNEETYITTRLAALDDGNVKVESIGGIKVSGTDIVNKKDSVDDGQEGKGLDLEALEIEIDKLLESETEESLNEFLRQRGYLKSPFYCQSDIEDRPICVSQCDHCRVYYKPLESPALPVADGEGEKVCKRCQGEKYVEKNIPSYEGEPERDVTIVCPECEGTGLQ